MFSLFCVNYIEIEENKLKDLIFVLYPEFIKATTGGM